jgi:hypothetical protein
MLSYFISFDLCFARTFAKQSLCEPGQAGDGAQAEARPEQHEVIQAAEADGTCSGHLLHGHTKLEALANGNLWRDYIAEKRLNQLVVPLQNASVTRSTIKKQLTPLFSFFLNTFTIT